MVTAVAPVAGRFALKIALFWIATTPATCGCVVTPQFAEPGQVWLVPGGVLDNTAPSVLKSGPAEAVLELKAIVLLMMFTAVESCSEIPAPSQPATLSAMMLLVTVTVFHWLGSVGKATISEPLTAWNAIPPPLPDSAAFPMMRLALITKPGPTPSLGPTAEIAVVRGSPVLLLGLKGTQSVSIVALP